MKPFHHPYTYNENYTKRVAYFCMEFGINQAFKTFSGGLGYLAGSHMRSAYDLKQNMIGISILWQFGYYDQIRKADHGMAVLFMERFYNFLEDTGIVFEITVNKHPVKVKALYLAPDVFQTVPMYFLSTNLPENDHLARTICHRLYDSEINAKIAQYILLGKGGAILLDKIQYHPDRIHLNEAHGLPAAFYHFRQHKNLEKIKEQLVFTTHTPVPAGNEEHDIHFLKEMGFFCGNSMEEVREITKITEDRFNLTLGALRLAGRANGVSKMHGEVARQMWSSYDSICPIDHVTNAQHFGYWSDKTMRIYLDVDDKEGLVRRKKEMKKKLFKLVADQTGKIYSEDALTIVWARRFAPYKRAGMLTWDEKFFRKLMDQKDRPVQVIWAGKPYPMDYGAISLFNDLVRLSKEYDNSAVLVNYELHLSKVLKQGADLWLNTPRVTREASGTSGMTAAMNGAINFSTEDGWIPEFAKDKENCFLIPKADLTTPQDEQDEEDLMQLKSLLEDEIIPMYYTNQDRWVKIMMGSMRDVLPYFTSSRMAHEYYAKLY
jgi:starch phosphorylase